MHLTEQSRDILEVMEDKPSAGYPDELKQRAVVVAEHCGRIVTGTLLRTPEDAIGEQTEGIPHAATYHVLVEGCRAGAANAVAYILRETDVRSVDALASPPTPAGL